MRFKQVLPLQLNEPVSNGNKNVKLWVNCFFFFNSHIMSTKCKIYWKKKKYWSILLNPKAIPQMESIKPKLIKIPGSYLFQIQQNKFHICWNLPKVLSFVFQCYPAPWKGEFCRVVGIQNPTKTKRPTSANWSFSTNRKFKESFKLSTED